MGLEPGTLNVLQLAIGFLFVFFAFNSQGFIEQTVIDDNKDKVSEHAGYISQAIIYAIFTLANFIAAPIVGLLGARWSLVGGALTYGIFQAGFLFLNEPFLYISSALIGVGAAVIWTAQGKYIAMNSNDETASKHSSLFWGISQICIAGGGIFLYCVFRDMSKDADDKYHITDSKVKTVYGVFTAVTAVGVVILGLVRMKKTDILVESTESEEEERQLTFVELIKSTLQLFLTKRMLFMCVVFAYTGFELTFWSGIYPTSISFTQKLGKNTLTLLAFNAIAQGLGQATAGFLFGILGSKMKFFGRIRIVLLGWIIHLLVFIAVYINFPSNAPLKKTDDEGILKPPSQVLAIICGYFLGFGDACWNTQIFSFLVTKYNKQSAEAFSLFKFFQSLTAAIGFGYGTSLVMEGHLIILVVTGIAGIICFVIAERIPTKLADE